MHDDPGASIIARGREARVVSGRDTAHRGRGGSRGWSRAVRAPCAREDDGDDAVRAGVGARVVMTRARVRCGR